MAVGHRKQLVRFERLIAIGARCPVNYARVEHDRHVAGEIAVGIGEWKAEIGCPVSALSSDKGVGMSTQPHKPEPSEWLRLLTGNRLQTQVSSSAVLVGGALGVMGLDVAVALIVLGGGGAYGLSIFALLALGCSFGLAMRALRLPNAKDAGPSLAAMRRAREAEDARAFEDSLLDDLEVDVRLNERAVARKTLLFAHALNFLAFATLVELVGRGVQ